MAGRNGTMGTPGIPVSVIIHKAYLITMPLQGMDGQPGPPGINGSDGPVGPPGDRASCYNWCYNFMH